MNGSNLIIDNCKLDHGAKVTKDGPTLELILCPKRVETLPLLISLCIMRSSMALGGDWGLVRSTSARISLHTL